MTGTSRPPRPRHQRGAALITAVLIAALATVLAVRMLEVIDLQRSRLESRRDHAQAQALAEGAIDYARAVLAEDSRSTAGDYPAEPWTTKLAPMSTDLGEVSGYIEDLQGRFNLNNLAPDGRPQAEALALFQRLLLALELSEQEAEALAASLADWLDSDSELRPGGAEDVWYRQQMPPRLTANRPLTSLDELLTVRGFTPAIVARLRPYVSVLPGPQPINVNFAAPPLLQAVVPGLDLAGARQLAAAGEQLPFRDLIDFQKRLAASREGGAALPYANLGTNSLFFVAHVAARSGAARVHLEAVLQRRPGSNWPRVESRRTK